MKSIQLTKCMVIAFFAVLLSIVYGNPLLFETEAQSFGVEPEVYMDAVSNIMFVIFSVRYNMEG